MLIKLVDAALTDKALFARVLSEKEVEHHAQNGRKGKHHQPRHGFHWLTVLHQHVDHTNHDDDDVDA